MGVGGQTGSWRAGNQVRRRAPNRVRLLGVLAVAALLGILTGAAGPAGAAEPGTSTDAPTVRITAGAGVDQALVTVEPGQTVVWINESGANQTLVADDASFDSGELSDGDRFQFAFTEPGTVTYTVVSMSGVTGTVVVNPVAAGPIPTPAVDPTAAPPAAPTDMAYTGAASVFTGGTGLMLLAFGVVLVLSARRFGLVALSGLSYFLAPDDLLPSRKHRRIRRDRARKGY